MKTAKRKLVFPVVLAALALLPVSVHSEEATKVSVTFLDRAAAATAIVDEKPEPYFSVLQPFEMIAKTGGKVTAKDLSDQRNECRKIYQASVHEFTEEEKTAIRDTVVRIHDALKEQYPLFAETPWSFLKLDRSIEGGMAHTRGAHIVIPDSVARKFVDARAHGVDPLRSSLSRKLVHEQSHVVQRAHPDLFAEFYTQTWGFLRAKKLPSCPWLDKVQIVNPDGADVGWVFPAKDAGATTYYQPLVVLRDGVTAPRMPQDFETIGLVMEKKGDSFALRIGKDGKPAMCPLDGIPPWQAAFGDVEENFHPNEIFAVLFSNLVMKDHLGEEGPGLEPCTTDLTKLREWCLKRFGVGSAAQRK